MPLEAGNKLCEMNQHQLLCFTTRKHWNLQALGLWWMRENKQSTDHPNYDAMDEGTKTLLFYSHDTHFLSTPFNISSAFNSVIASKVFFAMKDPSEVRVSSNQASRRLNELNFKSLLSSCIQSFITCNFIVPSQVGLLEAMSPFIDWDDWIAFSPFLLKPHQTTRSNVDTVNQRRRRPFVEVVIDKRFQEAAELNFNRILLWLKVTTWSMWMVKQFRDWKKSNTPKTEPVPPLASAKSRLSHLKTVCTQFGATQRRVTPRTCDFIGLRNVERNSIDDTLHLHSDVFSLWCTFLTTPSPLPHFWDRFRPVICNSKSHLSSLAENGS